MKIKRISVYQANLPIIGGYVFAAGKTVTIADSTIVCLEADSGLQGWGEACPLGPFYLPSYAQGIRAGLSVLAPRLIGLNSCHIGALNRHMDQELQGHGYVKSAIDVAAHDLLGKSSGLPVHALLGGRQMPAASMYWSVSQGRPEDMQAAVSAARQQGYRQFQLKVGGRPRDDVERIRAGMQDKLADEIFLCDANTGWRRDAALQVAYETEDLDYILEQPCERYADNLAVRRRIRQTLKLDESLQTAESVTRALADDACDFACVKITKMGGLTKSRYARDVLAAHGIPMTVEDVWGGDIVTAALGHLAISTPPAVMLNTTNLNAYNDACIASCAPKAKNGMLYVSEEPGLGIEPDLNVLGNPVAVYK